MGALCTLIGAALSKMDLNVEQDIPDGIQPVVEDVETVEVVSGSEGVLSPPGTDSDSKVPAPSQLSVPSSGVSQMCLFSKGETFSVHAQNISNS